MRAIRITTENVIETLTIADGPDRLSELQTAVGGLIEVVNLTEGLDLIADEEGLHTRRPFNYYGTLIPRLFDVPVMGIVGDVLLVGTTETSDGVEFADAPEAAYDKLATLGFKLDRTG